MIANFVPKQKSTYSKYYQNDAGLGLQGNNGTCSYDKIIVLLYEDLFIL